MSSQSESESDSATATAQAPEKSKSWISVIAEKCSRLFAAGVWFVVGCTVMGLFNDLGWPFELGVHFKIEYTVILLAGVLLRLPVLTTEKLKSHNNRFAIAEFAVFFVCFVFNAAGVIPYYFPSSLMASTSNNSPALKFLAINLNAKNRAYGEVAKYIKEASPDVLSFEEFNAEWSQAMETQLTDFPYKMLVPRLDNFGMAVFSKIPFQEPAKIFIASKIGTPSIFCKFELAGKPLSAIFTHTIPPLTPELTVERNNQIKAIAKLRNETKGSFILAGDINCSPWAGVFSRLCKDAGLRDSQEGFGLQASWPVYLFNLRTPIDHFLVSEDLCVSERGLGPDIGSDHFPIFVRIQARN